MARPDVQVGAAHTVERVIEPEVVMFEKLIVGVDGREGGRDAIALARVLARATGARLTLVHAYPHDPLLSRAANRDFDQAARDAALNLLATERDAAALAEQDAELFPVVSLSPARALHRIAAHAEAPLIIVGSCHHGALGRVVAGDDVRGTLYGAPCAVAVAPRGLAERGAHVLKRMGVGYDGSPESADALSTAVELARGAGGSVRAVEVVGPPLTPAFAWPVMYDWAALEQDRRKLAQDRLDQALAGLDVPADSEVIFGGAGEELTRISEHVDLLVLGSRGFGPTRRVMLGSTSDRLVHHAHAPVMVVPRTAASDDDELRDETAEAATSR